MAIFKKLQEIQKGLRSMTKNEKAYGYDYISGDKLLSYVRPAMDEKNLLLMPEVVSLTTTPITYQSKGGSKTEVLAEIHMRMTWVDSEDGETLSQDWASNGCNGLDKGFGSALTYGERYYLLKLFHIQTDKDDVDAIASKRDREMEESHRVEFSQLPGNERKQWITALAANKKNNKGVTAEQAFREKFQPTDDEWSAIQVLINLKKEEDGK